MMLHAAELPPNDHFLNAEFSAAVEHCCRHLLRSFLLVVGHQGNYARPVDDVKNYAHWIVEGPLTYLRFQHFVR